VETNGSRYSHEVREHDVLIIGAGGAGLRAAIAATERGLSVGVVTKSLLGKAHTVMAEGGVAASMGNVDPDDGWQTHFMDTLRSGKFLNNWQMAEIFAKEAPDRVYELEQWGALFNRTEEGKISQRPFGGHTYRRLCHVGDRTGLEMIRTLQERTLATDARVYMETTVTRLFKNDEGRVVGALAYTRESGRFIHFKAKAVVMATGGWGRNYKVTSNSWEGTGDGAVLAFDAGAELVDMEMVQFHPTGMVWPPGVRGLLVTEGVRGEGGVLKKLRGRAVHGELRLREDGAVDARRGRPGQLHRGHRGPGEPARRGLPGHHAPRVQRHHEEAPTMYEQFKNLADIDISQEPMEVFPTIHYVMGGIKVDAETCETNVPGLFAAGECAGGLHGANRLGGNSLSDLLVFGRRAGEGAAEYVKSNGYSTEIDSSQIDTEKQRVLEPLERQEGENPYELQQKVQEAMMEHANLMRNEDSLQEGLEKILEVKERVPNVKAQGSTLFNPGWHASQDIRYLTQISEIILRTALERTERRGAQWRLDYDGPSDELG
jgi:succinate dehydrogenase / fumarate reductase flavoprotein subunit